MSQKQFNFYNNITGWMVFAIATFVYLSTIQPTSSLWDTGEFIAAAYKLQVVHPPGAPFFLMFNRLFTMLAPSQELVAIMVNASSALASAFAVLFLFWTISMLARKIRIKNENNIGTGELLAVLGSSVVGALAFTFTDSFWFSAVEGEVYALSSMIMALVFWLMLKWERRAHQQGHLKWLILIAYLLGLSIAVHLLSLLVIPALAFLYYFKQFMPTWKGIMLAGASGLGALLLINTVVIKWLPAIASEIEVLFVNSMGLPFWSGIYFTMLLIVGLVIYGIYWSHVHQRVVFNTLLLGVTAVLIGFSTYSMVVIRSNANPSIDMNDPESVFSLISYLNREQYGTRPILYGPQFTANAVEYEQGSMQYRKSKEKYIATGRKRIPKYDEEHQTLFPRMADKQRQNRKQFYRDWEDLGKGEKPSFTQNLHFFFTYQLGQMYWRYFAWNFIGRQNDVQGVGNEFNKGNWMSGIGPIDEALTSVGPQENLPYQLQTNDARNHLYFLPFLLGIIGLVYHFRKRRTDAFTMFVLFFMTGIALIIYLNQPPIEPRERDYTSVGSFYAFAVWIGLGVLFLIEWLNKVLELRTASVIATLVALLAVPGLMAKEEWDDHDRSDTYIPRTLAVNYLSSCDSNAVLFTNGDNETYPLWYVQEVEDYRPDVRVINLSLLSTEWYGGHLRMKANKAPGLDFSTPNEKVVGGKRKYMVHKEDPQFKVQANRHYNLKKIIEFMASDDNRTQVRNRIGQPLNFFPTKKFKIPVNKEKVKEQNVVEPKNYDRIADAVRFKYPNNNMLRGHFLALDFIANNDWDRPVNFSITSGSSAYMGLEKYFRMDGLIFRLVPIKEQQDLDGQTGWMNTDVAYQHVMNEFVWGNLPKKDIYIGSVAMKQCRNFRNVFNRLATTLVAKNKNDSAEKVLDKGMKVLPEKNAPYGFIVFNMVENYYKIGAAKKGKKYGQRIYEITEEELDYYLDLEQDKRRQVEQDIRRGFYILRRMRELAKDNNQQDFADKLNESFKQFRQQYRGGSM